MVHSTRLFTALVFLSFVSLAACNDVGSPAPGGSSAQASNPSGSSAAYTISGAVSGAAATTVKLMGATANTTITSSSGSFSFSGINSGKYTIAPSRTGYVFNPVSRAAIVQSASVNDVGFSAKSSTALTYTISGTVSGSIASGVMITLNGVNVGSAVTDLGGNYTFSGLASGTYTLSASLDGYAFSRPLVVSLGTTDSASNDFTSSTSAGANISFTQVNTLPQATVGLAYSSSVVASVTGGTEPYYYQTAGLSAGTPPLGMVLNPNGNLTGTPTIPGKYDFSVCAIDSTGETSSCEPTSITVVTAGTPVPPSAPTATLAASKTTIVSGTSSTLTWSSKNASTCSASGAWTGVKATSGTQSVSPTSTTTYTLTCSGTGGSSHASSVTITVDSPTTPPAAPTATLGANPATITSGNNSTLTWSSNNASSCTASGGWTGTKGTNGTQSVSPTSTTTYTIACTSSSGTAQTSVKINVNPADAGTTTPPPAPGTSWVYYNGQFDWPGDYSFQASANYKDSSGAPLSGAYDVKVTLNSAWGGWLPYAQNWDFNSQPYTKLTVALKPTVANQVWHIYFVKVGDIPVGVYIDPAKYGPAPVAGKWATYTIPLADLGVLGTSIYKFCIQDQTGLSNNTWYVDNVGFAP